MSPVFSTAAPKCVCIRPPAGARHLFTGRFVYTVTRGWVGSPNERAPFRFHGAVVVFVERCLSRTRNHAASSKHLAEFFSGRSWPKIGPGFFFFVVFEKFETFFSKISAHRERYRNLLAGIFEILTFNGNIAFPLSPVSVIQIPRHFDQVRGSIVCAKHGPIQIDLHYTAVFCLSTVVHLM